MSDDVTERERDADVTKREGAGSVRSARTGSAGEQRLERGTLVGRYVVLDVLGSGGMGIVYAGYDPELDRKVAIKLLQAQSGSDSQSGGERAWLLREAQALARLAHPNVIAVHDVGALAGDRVFVAMELVEGKTLRAWLEEPRTWRDVVGVMRQAGTGLAAAHAAGLVHRDFKPENVLVGDDGRVRVMDFGLARLGGEAGGDEGAAPASRDSDLQIESKSPLAAQLTIAGHVVGTPAYMAPELYAGTAADARTDQFAFGVTLYEALFRARPYDRDTPREEWRAPRPPADSDVPAKVQRVALRALALEPTARFASMTELLAELAVDPAARRRRVMIAGGAALVAAAASVAIVVAARSSSVKCRGMERRLAGTWDAALRDKIRTAFVAAKVPYAERAFAGLEHALDAYAREWTQTAVETCEATRVRGEQTEEVFALREACLERRRDELGAVTHLLVDADAGLVEKGDKIVFGLEPVAQCSNVAQLRAADQPPTEPRATLEALRSKLADAKAQLIAGRMFPALVAAQASVELAQQLHYEPWAAEALLVRATALYTTGNFDDSIAAFADATWSGLRGHRDDVSAGAALSAALSVSDAQGKSAAAKVWVGLGEAIADRTGMDLALARRRELVAGTVAAQADDYVTAIARHEKMLVLAERLFGKENPELWEDEEVLGATLEKAGEFARSLPHFEHSLALRERSVGADHPDVALILTSMGPCYLHAGQLDKARASYDRAIALRERLYGKNSPILIVTLNNMADMLRLEGDPASALPYVERAQQIAAKVPGTAHPMYHTIATTHAQILAALGRTADAHALFDEILALEDKTSSSELRETLISRAEVAADEQDWKTAESLAQRAMVMMEAGGGKDSADLWRPLTVVGRTQLARGAVEDARASLQRALAIGEKLQLTERDLAATRAALARIK